MSRAVTPAITTILLAATLLTASPASADDLEALLARPVSPGTLGLLMSSAKDPRVEARWRASLSDGSPVVRATAARLLLVNGVAGSVRDLASLLAKDPDPSVALEAAHAVLVMGTGPVEDAVLAAARRLKDGRLALAIAEARGSASLGRLPQLRPLVQDVEILGRLVRALVGGGERELDVVAQAALDGTDAPLWNGVLTLAHDAGIPLSATRIAGALRVSSPAIRASTWWHVAATAAAGSFSTDLVPDPSTDALEGVPADLAFGRELAARVLKRTKRRDVSLTGYLSGKPLNVPSFAMGALGTVLYGKLDKKERETLGVVKVDRSPAALAPRSDYPGLRTVANLPDGYVADVMAVSGCTLDENGVLAGAIVRYSPSRHLQELQWISISKPLAPACTLAARAIVAAGLLPAPPSAKPGDRNWILLPMTRQFVRCLSRMSMGVEPAGKVGQHGIVPPEKIRDVRPEYPPLALAHRRQGRTVLEADVSPQGCVDRVEVRVPSAMDFDLEAVLAVSGWAFTPTLLNGKPVPVLMTVTVEFSTQ